MWNKTSDILDTHSAVGMLLMMNSACSRSVKVVKLNLIKTICYLWNPVRPHIEVDDADSKCRWSRSAGQLHVFDRWVSSWETSCTQTLASCAVLYSQITLKSNSAWRYQNHWYKSPTRCAWIRCVNSKKDASLVFLSISEQNIRSNKCLITKKYSLRYQPNTDITQCR